MPSTLTRKVGLVNNRELDALEALKAEAEEQLEQEARSHPAVARLTTAPGFGTIRAAQVVAAQAVAIGITPRRVYDPEHRGRCPQPA